MITLPHMVTVQLPDHIFSEKSQTLRDQIAEWLEQYHLDPDSYESCYVHSPRNSQEGNWYTQGIGGVKFIEYGFEDRQLAILFKLTFG